MTEDIIINEKSLQAVLKRRDELEQENRQMKSALEEISRLASPHCTQCLQIINIIKEVLK